MANKTFSELEAEINLLEFALYHGYHLDKSSSTRRNPVVKGPSGETLVLKNTDQNHTARYFNATEGYNTIDRGNIIQFVKQRIGNVFPADHRLSLFGNVNKILHDYLNVPLEYRPRLDYKSSVEPTGRFDLNLYRLTGIERNNPYLTQVRAISPEIIQLPEFKDRIYTNVYQGKEYVTFPFYATDNTTVCGLNFRSEDTNKNAGRADKLRGLWTSKLPRLIETVVITESPIDAISLHELQGRQNSFYVSTFGRPTLEQFSSLASILAANKSRLSQHISFINAFDKDTSGQIFSLQAANFFSNGSYYVMAGENRKLQTVTIKIFDVRQLSEDERTLMHFNRPEDYFQGRTVFNAMDDQKTSFDFHSVCSDFIRELDVSFYPEKVAFDQKQKFLSLQVQNAPEASRRVNTTFYRIFKQYQLVDVCPVLSNGKDFNDDLRTIKQIAQPLRQPVANSLRVNGGGGVSSVKPST